MAQTDHLPIYKATYDLCLYFEQVVRNFPRYHKYSIGQDLRDGARRTLRLIVRANARSDKAPVLREIREEVEELKVLLRLCHDAKGFASFNSFEHAIRHYDPFWQFCGRKIASNDVPSHFRIAKILGTILPAHFCTRKIASR